MIERRRNSIGESVTAKRRRLVEASKQFAASANRFGIELRPRGALSWHAFLTYRLGRISQTDILPGTAVRHWPFQVPPFAFAISGHFLIGVGLAPDRAGFNGSRAALGRGGRSQRDVERPRSDAEA
jgi:hypothetical protein